MVNGVVCKTIIRGFDSHPQLKNMKKDKKCKRCDAPLNGVMLFYPTICLSCTIDLHSSSNPDDHKELKKYEKNEKKA